MLQKKPRMGNVERSPFCLPQRELERIAVAKLHELRLPRTVGQSVRLRYLILIALNSDHLPVAAHCPRDQTRELAKPAAKIQDILPWLEIKLSQAGLVQNVIEQGQPVLFFRRTAMNVFRRP